MTMEAQPRAVELRFSSSLMPLARGSARRQWMLIYRDVQTVGDFCEQIRLFWGLGDKNFVILRWNPAFGGPPEAEKCARVHRELPAAFFKNDDVLFLEEVAGIPKPAAAGGCSVCGVKSQADFSKKQWKLLTMTGVARCNRCKLSEEKGEVPSSTAWEPEAGGMNPAAIDSLTVAVSQAQCGTAVQSSADTVISMGRSDVNPELGTEISDEQEESEEGDEGPLQSFLVSVSSCEEAQEVISRFHGVEFENKPMCIQLADPDDPEVSALDVEVTWISVRGVAASVSRGMLRECLEQVDASICNVRVEGEDEQESAAAPSGFLSDSESETEESQESESSWIARVTFEEDRAASAVRRFKCDKFGKHYGITVKCQLRDEYTISIGPLPCEFEEKNIRSALNRIGEIEAVEWCRYDTVSDLDSEKGS